LQLLVKYTGEDLFFGTGIPFVPDIVIVSGSMVEVRVAGGRSGAGGAEPGGWNEIIIVGPGNGFVVR